MSNYCPPTEDDGANNQTFDDNFDLDRSITESIKRLSDAEVGDVQKIAASQIGLLSNYYNNALNQSKQSFKLALIVACFGFIFFIAAIIMINYKQDNLSYIPIIGGALIELIAGTLFFLYNKSKEQLAEFFYRLDNTQRFLIANSICEGLNDENKQKARSILIEKISEIKK